MLKREIKYKDFNGEDQVEVAYFHLSKTEIIEMEVATKEGLQATIQRIVKTTDRNGLITEFKRIILASYGVKSDDGRRFVKSEELRTEFSQTAAYDVLFMELATSDKLAVDFIQGILPEDMAAQLAATPPPPPPPPNVTPTVQIEQ